MLANLLKTAALYFGAEFLAEVAFFGDFISKADEIIIEHYDVTKGTK